MRDLRQVRDFKGFLQVIIQIVLVIQRGHAQMHFEQDEALGLAREASGNVCKSRAKGQKVVNILRKFSMHPLRKPAQIKVMSFKLFEVRKPFNETSKCGGFGYIQNSCFKELLAFRSTITAEGLLYTVWYTVCWTAVRALSLSAEMNLFSTLASSRTRFVCSWNSMQTYWHSAWYSLHTLSVSAWNSLNTLMVFLKICCDVVPWSHAG